MDPEKIDNNVEEHDRGEGLEELWHSSVFYYPFPCHAFIFMDVCTN